MKLALHRSITFLFGILVMAFVCWAWRDSEFYISYVSQDALMGCSWRSGVSIIVTAGPKDYPRNLKVLRRPNIQGAHDYFPVPCFISGGGGELPEDTGIYVESLKNAKTHREFLRISWEHRPKVDWELSIPYWLILLAVAIPWAALLLWRARRRKRAPEKNSNLASSRSSPCNAPSPSGQASS